METFGDYIKRIRIKRNFSLRETADKIGISATFLSRVENNKSVPSERFIREMAIVLDTDFDTMMHCAGRIAQDIVEIIKTDVGMPVFLRRVRDQNISSKDLMKLLSLGDNKKWQE